MQICCARTRAYIKRQICNIKIKKIEKIQSSIRYSFEPDCYLILKNEFLCEQGLRSK